MNKRIFFFLFFLLIPSLCHAQPGHGGAYTQFGPSYAFQIWLNDPMGYYGYSASPPSVYSAFQDLGASRATVQALTNGSVIFANNGDFAQDNTNFFWDNVNNFLGILTNSPSTALEVAGTASAATVRTGDYALPSGIPSDNYIMKWDAGTNAWLYEVDATGAGGVPAGPIDGIQYNMSNAFTAEAAFTYNESTDMLNVQNVTISHAADIIHTATMNGEHALEIDLFGAGFGGVHAVDIVYTTGAVSAGEDEAVILINIDEINATGGEIFGVEVLSTEGSADVYGIKVGATVGAVHQDSGVFANPTTGTNNTTSTDVSYMIDGNSSNTTSIFELDNDYILIGAAAAFQEIEFVITTGSSGAGIAPTFEYSIAGTHNFTVFSPVDGTNGFRNTGIVAWDASDVTSHVADDVTGTFDIKIARTKNNLATNPVLGYAKTAATTEYVWNKTGDVNVKSLEAATLTEGGVAIINATEGGTWTGTHDFNAAILEIPNAAAPTIDATGRIGVDTNIITQGMMEVYLASALAYVVATTDTPADNEVPTYDSGGGTIQWEAGGAGGGASNREITFLPHTAGFDATNPAIVDWITSSGTGTVRFPRAKFDDAEDDTQHYGFTMPSDATASADWSLDIYWYSDEDVAEDVVWAIQISATTPDDADNVEEQAVDTADTVTDSADASEAKALIKATLTIDYANCDGAVAGDEINFIFYRDGDNGDDNHTNECYLNRLHLKIPRS